MRIDKEMLNVDSLQGIKAIIDSIMNCHRIQAGASSAWSDSCPKESRTFEEKIDEQMKKLEAGVGGKLQKIDDVPGESVSSLTIRLVTLVRNMAGGLARFLKSPSIAFTATSQRMSDKPVTGWTRDIHDDSPAPAQDVKGNGLRR